MNKFEKAYFAIISQQAENIEEDYSLDNLFQVNDKFNGEKPDNVDFTYKNHIIPYYITLSNGNKCKIAIKGNIYISDIYATPYYSDPNSPYGGEGGLEEWGAIGYPFELSFDSVKNDEIILIKITDNNTSFKVKFSELSKADKYAVFNRIKEYFQGEEDNSFFYELAEDIEYDPQWESPDTFISLKDF